MRKMNYYSPSEAESVNKPYGAFKNESSPGTQDGTQAVAEHMQDVYYSIYQVMQLAGITPNNILEDGNTNKQFLSALSNVAPVLHNATTVYNKNVVVMNVDSNKIYFYKSLINENSDALTNADSWQELFYIDENGSFIFSKELKDVNLENALLRLDELYTGVDLTVKHAEEIQNEHNGDAWAWIHSRIQAVNFEGIHVGDYIPVTLSGGTIGGVFNVASNQQHKMQVAGIDTYYNSGDTPIPHHIDFISLETLETCSMWNEGNTNNGTSAEKNPWKSSRIYAILNGVNNYSTAAQGSLKHGLNCGSGGVYQMLPQAARNVIIQKRSWIEEQYDGSKQVNYPTGNKWDDVGFLWVPHEVEVCGYQPNSYNRNNDGGNLDNLTRNLSKWYPLFKQQTRVKLGADTHQRSNYWLCCPSGIHPTLVCFVDATGPVTTHSATNTYISACFGFRVG